MRTCQDGIVAGGIIACCTPVMEIDNSLFQDMESYGKERFFKMAMEKRWIFVWENSMISFDAVNVMFFHFIIHSIKHNHLANHKI